MTSPRPVIPGRSYILTRRSSQRQFLLRPDPQVEQVYSYCLGEAADRYDVTLNGYLAMSNHQHVIVHDRHANVPRFFAHLNKLLSKVLNAYWGRWENLWATEQASMVHLVTPQDRFDKLVYLLANPVAAHLVERAADWPGASSLSQHLSGEPRWVGRPSFYFKKTGPMPEQVRIRIERPDGFGHLTDAEWVAELASALRAAEERAREERVAKNIRCLGRAAILAADHTDRPTTLAPRRGLRPEVACAEPETRKAMLAAVRGFRAAHRGAMRQLRAGDRDVTFPEGTYRIRVLGVAAAGTKEDLVPELRTGDGTKDG